MSEEGMTQELFVEWCRLDDLPKLAPDKFPSVEAAKWAWRANKGDLVAGDAAIELGGRIYIHPRRFEDVMLQKAKRRMAERLARR